MTQNVLITGASGGIGYELALLFAKDKYNLILTARSEKNLQKIKSELEQKYGVTVRVICGDLSQPGFSNKIYKETIDNKINIDILVNNAGFGDFGYFHTTDIQKLEEMINLNILALTKLSRLFIPGMVERKSGKILNLASVAAFFPGPLMTEYYATKAYVLSFTVALANELKGTGVTVTALCPGPTESNFSKTASAKESGLFNKKLPTAAHVAAFGYKKMKKGKLIPVHGFGYAFLTAISGIIPRKIAASVVRRIQEIK